MFSKEKTEKKKIGKKEKRAEVEKECVFSKWLVSPDKLIDVRHRMAMEKKRR